MGLWDSLWGPSLVVGLKSLIMDDGLAKNESNLMILTLISLGLELHQLFINLHSFFFFFYYYYLRWE